MSAEDRARTYRDALYAYRSPREKSEQAAFRRYVTRKIDHLNETVDSARDQYDAKRVHFPKLFMVHYNHYQTQLAQFFMELDRTIARTPSSTLVTRFSPFLERLKKIVDRMIEIVRSPSEIPVFPEKKEIPGVASLGERLRSFRKDRPTAVHKKVPLSHIPMLRQTYEYEFRRIDQDVQSIQADPGISQRRLDLFKGEKLYYQHLRTTYSNIVEQKLKDGVEGIEPLKDEIDRFVEDLERIVQEIQRLSTGPDSSDGSSSG